MKKLLFSTYFLMFTVSPVFAQNLESTINRVGRNGQKIFLAALPLFALAVGWAYKKGDSGAKDKMMNLIMGTILVSSAFGVARIFR